MREDDTDDRFDAIRNGDYARRRRPLRDEDPIGTRVTVTRDDGEELARTTASLVYQGDTGPRLVALSSGGVVRANRCEVEVP